MRFLKCSFLIALILGTKYLVPGTWYQVLGTKYLVPAPPISRLHDKLLSGWPSRGQF